MARLQKKNARRRRRGWWIFALVVVIVAAGGGMGWFFSAGPGGQIAVPGVATLSPDEAAASLEASGLHAEQTQANSTSVAAGSIIGTDPGEGSFVLNGSTVQVVISAGPALLPVPQLVGLQEADARQAATASHFTLTDSQTQFSDSAASGVVIQALGAGGVDLSAITDAAGAPVTYGDQQPITLLVSLGAVPNVVGTSADQANATLVAVGLTSSVDSSDYNETVAEGDVISYSLPADPVKPGANVSLTVSKGPAPVQVPDVTGASWDKAKATLQAAGFTLAYNGIADLAPSAFTVSNTDPAPGDLVPKGSKISVSFGGF